LFGYMGKLLRVDLDLRKAVEESVDEKILRTYIGGLGFRDKNTL